MPVSGARSRSFVLSFASTGKLQYIGENRRPNAPSQPADSTPVRRLPCFPRSMAVISSLLIASNASIPQGGYDVPGKFHDYRRLIREEKLWQTISKVRFPGGCS